MLPTDDALDAASVLVELTRLPADTADVAEVLQAVSRIAARLPEVDGVAVRSAEAQRADVTSCSSDIVSQLEDLQTRLAEGPTAAVANQPEPTGSALLSGDARWPRFGPRAGRLGVHSALAVPLRAGDGVVGTLTLYSGVRDAFTPARVPAVHRLAEVAAVVLRNALAFARAQRLAEQFQAASDDRAQIERAVGIVLSRRGGTPDEALSRLRLISQQENEKLVVVADRIVSEAIRRAQTRSAAG